jgi:hypothetical protein
MLRVILSPLSESSKLVVLFINLFKEFIVHCCFHICLKSYRVFGVLKFWLENYFFSDFKDEPELIALLIHFLRYITLRTKADTWILSNAHRMLVSVLQFSRGEIPSDATGAWVGASSSTILNRTGGQMRLWTRIAVKV